VATYEKRGDKWRAQIYVGGVRESATFPDKTRAVAWATKTEGELRAMARGEIIVRSVLQALERYGEHVSPLHRGCRWEQVRLNKMARTLPFARRRMQDVAKADITAWRDSMLEHLATSSARREFGLLRAVFALAVSEWQWLHRSPFAGIKPPAEGKARSQRVSDTDIARVLKALSYEPMTRPETASQFIGAAILFAVETAMRQGEILSLDHESRRGRVIYLVKTKNGDERAVPLSTRAAAIMDLLPNDGFAFPVNAGTFDTLFRRARDGVGLDFHFHDLRREATSRLAKRLEVMDLAKMTGHRDVKVLLRTYYAPDMESVADRLG
jgi:integrase